jgi:hypothetical protein
MIGEIEGWGRGVPDSVSAAERGPHAAASLKFIFVEEFTERIQRQRQFNVKGSGESLP